MEKIPVGRSISHAYQFLFGRVFQIIGTAWLPALLYAVGCYFWLQNAVTWMAPITHDQSALTRGIAATAGLFALLLVSRAVMGISLTQEVLGIRNDIQLAHFVIGPREVRLVFAQIRFYLTVLVLYLLVMVVVVLGLGAAAKYGAAIPRSPRLGNMSLVQVGAIAAAVVLFVAFILTTLKLVFLLNAVASVEHHAKIRRAWHLAAGSGWRIVLVLLGVFLPVYLIGTGVLYYLTGADLAAAMHAGAPGTVQRSHALLQFYADHAALMALFVGIAGVISGALMAGATAAAYRTVTGHEEPELEDDAALVAPLLAPAVVHAPDPEPVVSDHGHDRHDEPAHGHGHEDHGHRDHGHEDSRGHGGHRDDGHGHGDHARGHEDAHGRSDDDEADESSDGDDGSDEDDHHHDDSHGRGHGDHTHGHDDHGHNNHGHGHRTHSLHEHDNDRHGHGDGRRERDTDAV